MNRLTVLKLMLIAGLMFILAGVMLIAIYSSIEFVGPIYTFLGILLILFGLIWVAKVKKYINKERVKARKAKSSFHAYAVAFLALVATSLAMSSVAQAQVAFSRECYVMYQRVVYVEYFLIGLLIIAGFLAFAPIILGRTILGPILQELQYIAGAMLILLIFALLVIFPLDPMFVFDNPQNPTACYVDVRRLEAQGPPILQVLLKLFTPPPPTFP